MKNKTFFIKSAAFILVLLICILRINAILLPKFTSADGWPTTSTFLKFYDLEKNSVDVLFLGSSHMVAAMNPVQLYDDYGISGYNLGSEQQNLFVSYYWLKEALKYQNPKVVVLDCYFLERVSFQPFNSEESFIRKAFDYMRWSEVKCEAVHELCKVDQEQSELSYYLTNIRFHSRWMSLSEGDFASRTEVMNYDGLKGYKVLTDCYGEEDYEPIVEGQDNSMGETVDMMHVYLDKIVDLCRQNNIELILIKTPYKYEDAGMHNAISAYAKENDVPFYDFNEKGLYEVVGYDFAEDNCEASHVNAKGAAKLTDFIGKLLQTKW